MTRREEIREWLARYLTKQFISDPDALPVDECYMEADDILAYLQTRGVVIEVEEVGIKTITFVDDTSIISIPRKTLSKAGYVAVEPLI